jgi:hypothetical protein
VYIDESHGHYPSFFNAFYFLPQNGPHVDVSATTLKCFATCFIARNNLLTSSAATTNNYCHCCLLLHSSEEKKKLRNFLVIRNGKALCNNLVPIC